MRMRSLALASLLAAACADQEGTENDGGGGKGDDPAECAEAALDTGGVCRGVDGRFEDAACCSQDVVSTELTFDVTTRDATANLTVAGSDNRSIVLEVGDLTIQSVTGDADDVAFEVEDGKLIVTAADGEPTSEW